MRDLYVYLFYLFIYFMIIHRVHISLEIKYKTRCRPNGT